MSLIYTTWEDWVLACESESRLVEFSRGGSSEVHPKLEKAEAQAAEEMLGFLGKRYGSEPLDNMTVLTKGHLLNLGLWFLTDYGESRPENITTNARATRDWLIKVSTGVFTLKEKISDSVKTKTEQLAGVIFSQSPGGATWDRDDPQSESSIRLGPPL